MRGFLRRQLYLISVYSGMRALWNLFLSRLQPPQTLNSVIDQSILKSDLLGELLLAVHSRPCPPSGDPYFQYGMISIRQCNPKIHPFLYRYFCTTSHFGFGTMEIAFFARGREFTCYAIRNIGCSNAERLGFSEVGRKLRLSKRNEETQLLREVSALLQRRGCRMQFASSEECLNLSISPGLLNTTSSKRARRAMSKKYAKLHRVFGPMATESPRSLN